MDIYLLEGCSMLSPIAGIILIILQLCLYKFSIPLLFMIFFFLILEGINIFLFIQNLKVKYLQCNNIIITLTIVCIILSPFSLIILAFEEEKELIFPIFMMGVGSAGVRVGILEFQGLYVWIYKCCCLTDEEKVMQIQKLEPCFTPDYNVSTPIYNNTPIYTNNTIIPQMMDNNGCDAAAPINNPMYDKI